MGRFWRADYSKRESLYTNQLDNVQRRGTRTIRESQLKNAATNLEKAAAKKAIRRLDALKENKADIVESCGKKPTRKSFATEEGYRLALNAHWDHLDFSNNE